MCLSLSQCQKGFPTLNLKSIESSLSKASEESFKQVRQSLLRDYHPDKLGILGTLFSAKPGMELQRPIDYVYECISARKQ